MRDLLLRTLFGYGAQFIILSDDGARGNNAGNNDAGDDRSDLPNRLDRSQVFDGAIDPLGASSADPTYATRMKAERAIDQVEATVAELRSDLSHLLPPSTNVN